MCESNRLHWSCNPPRFYFKRSLLMRSLCVALAFLLASVPGIAQDKVVLVIHGGAGALDKKSMTAEREKQYRDALELALKNGRQAIDKGSSLDGVEAAIKTMED